MKILQPLPRVIHLVYGSQRAVCDAFNRLQEFYESPYPEIHGNYFTREQHAERWARDHDKPYNQTWNGFNVPGNVVREFFGRFDDLSVEEQEIKAAVDPARTWSRFYLIATHRDEEITHELAHALWYVNPEYKLRQMVNLDNFIATSARETPLAHCLKQFLVERGYCEDVMLDEMHAYLSEAPLEYWQAHLGTHVGAMMWTMGDPFRATLKEQLHALSGRSN